MLNTVAGVWADPSAGFQGYLLGAVLRTTYIGALFGAIGGALGVAGWFASRMLGPIPAEALFAGSTAVALLASLIIINIARSALGMLQEVRRIREVAHSSSEA